MATKHKSASKQPEKKQKKQKKQKLQDLPAQQDPRAALDPALLLRAAQPVLTGLAADLLARAKGSPAVTAALKQRHAQERGAERTADPYDTWLRAFVEQVAAAWLLSCVFVRVLEDRGLVEQNRIAGPGALDSQQLFFELAPSLSERDYLLMVLRELSQLPAARDLFDARHNPVWLLAPSAEGARELLALFRTPSPHAPALRFGQQSTRFLGDLYQDLSEDVRKRYALLQTPDFVERFILDRTLERAIERFGLDETTLIDPTCGSGHFLLGAFDRLLEHRLRSEPGLDVRQAALKALDAVSGADINPYAIAIARFRLTLAYLDKTGHDKLAQAPQLPLHLVVADSLLHNPQGKLESAKRVDEQTQMGLGEVEGADRTAFEGEMYALEDEAAARDVLHRRYAAVVGNPPYITPKDKALKGQYKRIYATCHMGYSLAVPFKERFFQLARQGGSVGMITANSFMKREFGKKVVEEFLPKVNLDLIINTSGAYIPGHGTPTVLLFGTSEPPTAGDVLTVLAKRGEPSTPADPERGLVWSSIAGHSSELGYEDDYVSVAHTAREDLSVHPWSLAGGGAGELKALLEGRAEATLKDVIDDVGFSIILGEDELFLRPRGGRRWKELPRVPLIIGELVRDWSLTYDEEIVCPFDLESLEVTDRDDVKKELWPWRAALEKRIVSGSTSMKEANRKWFDVRRLSRAKHQTPLSITFAFVATHNHFVLDRGGKVFNRSAPIIKLPETATEDDHLALLAYLNSSTACFYCRQVLHCKGAQGVNEGHKAEEWEQFLEFSGTQIAGVPLPPDWQSLADVGRVIDTLAAERAALDFREAESASRERALLTEMVALQETIDFRVYNLFQLIGEVTGFEVRRPGDRDFERDLHQRGTPTEWFARHGYERPEKAQAVELPRPVRLLEQPLYKRRWLLWDADERAERTRKSSELQTLESELAQRSAPAPASAFVGGGDLATAPPELTKHAAPFLAAHRHTDAGLEKHAAWERTWDLQRREDAGEDVGDIPVPPKYAQKDYRAATYWRLRGKLDVPKERFISYPGCESDEDGEPLYGWAGWNHLQQAQALAALYEQRKAEGWQADRLTPMLAGLLELLPWIKQWHNEPSDEYDGMRLGDYFQGYLDGECATHSLSHEDLRAWRPQEKKRAAGKHKR